MSSKISKFISKLKVDSLVCVCQKNSETFYVVGVQKITDQFIKVGNNLFSLLTGEGIKGSVGYYLRKYDEYRLQLYIVNWLKKEYPDVMFHSDTGSGVRLPPGLSNKVSAIQDGRAYPDFYIFEPRNGFHGLYIEFKLEGTNVKLKGKKQGKYDWYTSEHIQEQAEVLSKLRERGYKAGFAVGIIASQKIISLYLK